MQVLTDSPQSVNLMQTIIYQHLPILMKRNMQPHLLAVCRANEQKIAKYCGQALPCMHHQNPRSQRGSKRCRHSAYFPSAAAIDKTPERRKRDAVPQWALCLWRRDGWRGRRAVHNQHKVKGQKEGSLIRIGAMMSDGSG